MGKREQQAQQSEERTVTIKCQRLTPDKRYEEVEVEVPQPIYETLRFYNEKEANGEGSGGLGQLGCRVLSRQELAKSKESLAAKIKRLLFAKN